MTAAPLASTPFTPRLAASSSALLLAALFSLFVIGALGALAAGSLANSAVITYTRGMWVNGSWLIRPDIFLHDLRRGLAINWTHTPTLNEEVPVWSPDGEQAAYLIGQFDSPKGRVCVLSFRRPEVCFALGPGQYHDLLWLPGTTHVAFWFSAPGQPQRLVRGDTNTGTTAEIAPWTADYGLYTDLYPVARRQRIRTNFVSADGRWDLEWLTGPDGRAGLHLSDDSAPQALRRLTPYGMSINTPVWWPGV